MIGNGDADQMPDVAAEQRHQLRLQDDDGARLELQPRQRFQVGNGNR